MIPWGPPGTAEYTAWWRHQCAIRRLDPDDPATVITETRTLSGHACAELRCGGPPSARWTPDTGWLMLDLGPDGANFGRRRR